MKLYYLAIATIFLIFITDSKVSAQDGSFSAGVEGALPVGDFADIGANAGVGITLGYERALTDHISMLVNGGIIWYFSDSYELTVTETDPEEFQFFDTETITLGQNITQIPIQIGGRYYFDETFSGLFAGFKAGVHITDTKFDDYEFGGAQIEGRSDADTYFSTAPELGYFFDEHFSVQLRYQLIFATGDEIETTFQDPLTLERTTNMVTLEETVNSYVGLRAAYHF